MAAKFTRLTHKIAVQLHLVAEICTICNFRSRLPARKLLDSPSHVWRTVGLITFFSKDSFRSDAAKLLANLTDVVLGVSLRFG
jgi:hypothetical protein